MKALMALVVLVLLAFGGCGGDSDNAEPAPVDPESIESDTDASDCDSKGINTTEGETGTCVDEAGATAIVVNRRDTLKLDEFTAKLGKVVTKASVDAQSEGTIKANGVFVIADLKIANESTQPVDWGSGLDGRVALTDGENTYAHNGGQAAFWHELSVTGGDGSESLSPIQPGETRTEYVGFDVPEDVPARLGDRGAGLLLVQTDDLLDAETDTYGNIRLWK